MNIRCKFQLQRHEKISYGGEWVYHTFIFIPSYDPAIPEDQRFAKATPNGEIRLSVDNPTVVEYWASKLGQYFYFDSIPVPVPALAA